MPDRRRHRGPHPSDSELFGDGSVPALRQAVADLSWLLSRGYAEKSAAWLVGDRHRLRQRQRIAVMRCACPDAARDDRSARRLDAVRDRPLAIDGYNVLTTVESALAHGVLLLGRDGCLRDMASMHGSWRRVEETETALVRIGAALGRLGASPVLFYFDAPVSNSGRLVELVHSVADENDWTWDVRLVPDPDPILAASGSAVATADSAVLDACGPWFNLARHVVEAMDVDPWLVDLSAP